MSDAKTLFEMSDAGVAVCDRARAVHLLLMAEKPFFNLVSIRSPGCGDHPVDRLSDRALSVLPLEFEDLDREIPGRRCPPRLHHIAELVEWANNKNEILIHCDAGCSRSSACALVVLASRGTVEGAIEFLNPWLHWPNELIIELGARVVKQPRLVEAVKKWKEWNKKNYPWFTGD